MPPTLAELLAMPADDRPESSTTVTLVQGQHLLIEAKRLDDERTDLLLTAQRRADAVEDGKAPPRKSGEGGGAADRLDEIAAAQLVLRERLAELQGEVGLRGFTPGEWQRYKDEHPPRENSRDDRVVAGGWCNATDLLNDLGAFVASWNGEPVADATGVIARIASADLAQLVSDVVDMHQARLPRVPKATTSPETENDATA